MGFGVLGWVFGVAQNNAGCIRVLEGSGPFLSDLGFRRKLNKKENWSDGLIG